jgi:hypothetical protein
MCDLDLGSSKSSWCKKCGPLSAPCQMFMCHKVLELALDRSGGYFNKYIQYIKPSMRMVEVYQRVPILLDFSFRGCCTVTLSVQCF